MECCSGKDKRTCQECPLRKEPFVRCFEIASTNTLDYINHLETENEGLSRAVSKLTNRVCDLKEKAKAEAYKEVIEKLKKRYSTRYTTSLWEMLCEELDYLYKELTTKSAE